MIRIIVQHTRTYAQYRGILDIYVQQAPDLFTLQSSHATYILDEKMSHTYVGY